MTNKKIQLKPKLSSAQNTVKKYLLPKPNHPRCIVNLQVGREGGGYKVQELMNSDRINSNDHQQPSSDVVSKMSSVVFAINWQEYFPIKLAGEFDVALSNYDECIAFTKKHYSELFALNEESPFLWNDFDNRKKQYYQMAGDFFSFHHRSTLVGVYCGSTIDWSSYYLRHTLILKEHQGTGLYQDFFQYLTKILQNHGVKRLEGDIAPTNNKHIHLFQKMGFKVSGINLSERWGAMVHMVKLMDFEANHVFERQFCHGFNNT